MARFATSRTAGYASAPTRRCRFRAPAVPSGLIARQAWTRGHPASRWADYGTSSRRFRCQSAMPSLGYSAKCVWSWPLGISAQGTA